jgi:hypothetical protein
MPTPATEHKHTPTPWHANLASICNIDGLHITAVEGYGMTTEQDRANRDFIVHAVNSHAALVAALTRIKDGLPDDRAYRDAARSALALATLNK